MNKKLENILRNLSDHDLPKWFGQKTISRGRGYLNDVHEIVAMENGGVAAKVKGTHEYLAAITIDDDGNVEMECTCPVGIECKHCVALAMKCHELLLDGKRIKTVQAVNAARKAAIAQGMSMEEAMATITDETISL